MHTGEDAMAPDRNSTSLVTRASLLLHRASPGWVVVSAFAAFMLFGRLVMPGHVAAFSETTGGARLIDTHFWYSVDDIHALAEAYGEDGRHAYVRSRFGIDLAWPLLYGVFLAAAIGWASRKAHADASPWRRLHLMAPIAPLLDVAENIAAAVVVRAYPSRAPIAGGLATVITPAKWIAVGGSLAVLLVTASLALRRHMRTRTR